METDSITDDSPNPTSPLQASPLQASPSQQSSRMAAQWVAAYWRCLVERRPLSVLDEQNNVWMLTRTRRQLVLPI